MKTYFFYSLKLGHFDQEGGGESQNVLNFGATFFWCQKCNFVVSWPEILASVYIFILIFIYSFVTFFWWFLYSMGWNNSQQLSSFICFYLFISVVSNVFEEGSINRNIDWNLISHSWLVFIKKFSPLRKLIKSVYILLKMPNKIS